MLVTKCNFYFCKVHIKPNVISPLIIWPCEICSILFLQKGQQVQQHVFWYRTNYCHVKKRFSLSPHDADVNWTIQASGNLEPDIQSSSYVHTRSSIQWLGNCKAKSAKSHFQVNYSCPYLCTVIYELNTHPLLSPIFV